MMSQAVRRAAAIFLVMAYIVFIGAAVYVVINFVNHLLLGLLVGLLLGRILYLHSPRIARYLQKRYRYRHALKLWNMDQA